MTDCNLPRDSALAPKTILITSTDSKHARMRMYSTQRTFGVHLRSFAFAGCLRRLAITNRARRAGLIVPTVNGGHKAVVRKNRSSRSERKQNSSRSRLLARGSFTKSTANQVFWLYAIRRQDRDSRWQNISPTNNTLKASRWRYLGDLSAQGRMCLRS